MATSTDDLDVVDITSVERYDREGYPWAEWDLLRAVEPVHRYERAGFPAFWAVTRYDDIKSVHARPGEFRNGGPFLRLQTDVDLAKQDAYRRRRADRRGWDPEQPIDMVFLDRPEHLELRMLTLRRFTPPRCGGSRSTSPTSPAGPSVPSWPRRSTPRRNRSTSSRGSPAVFRWRRSAGCSGSQSPTGTTSCDGPTSCSSRSLPTAPRCNPARRSATPAVDSARSTTSGGPT